MSLTVTPAAVSLLAASSWPLVVPLVAPVLLALLVPAYVLGRNSRQRIANMLVGLAGSIAVPMLAACLIRSSSRPTDDLPVMPIIAAMVAGAVIGVALSVAGRWAAGRLARLMRSPQSARQGATDHEP